jgi:hypothetical protein
MKREKGRRRGRGGSGTVGRGEVDDDISAGLERGSDLDVGLGLGLNILDHLSHGIDVREREMVGEYATAWGWGWQPFVFLTLPCRGEAAYSIACTSSMSGSAHARDKRRLPMRPPAPLIASLQTISLGADFHEREERPCPYQEFLLFPR